MICIVIFIIYFVYTGIMLFQVIQLLPVLDPEVADSWLRLWTIENTQALVLLIAFIPVTAIIGIYLRVEHPSLNDCVREQALENGNM